MSSELEVRVTDAIRAAITNKGPLTTDQTTDERFLARAAIAEVQRWQPIETAPRDGTWFIAYRPLAMATGDKTIDIVQGVDHPTTSPQGIVHWTSRWCHPTHWIPLPVPPQN